ncbi:Replication factor C (RF-C) subunit, partial [Coelomomyces lativittatus]
MALWVDQYRPKEFDQLSFSETNSTVLERLAKSDGFPHLLVFGPPGSGKKTLIMITLRTLFGPGIDKIKIEQRIITTPSNRKIEVNLLVSNYHIEINPSEVGIHDRVIVQEFIKEVAQTQNIDASQKHRFKVLIISEADQLTLSAQHALRRTMEKYMSNLRIIFCCQSAHKIIPAIQSRCLPIRVEAPQESKISAALQTIAKQHGFVVDGQLTDKIAASSQRNARRANLMFETTYVTNNSP